jgi:hypothetical protein
MTEARDLVERLRCPATNLAEGYESLADLCHKAADEIERLRLAHSAPPQQGARELPRAAEIAVALSDLDDAEARFRAGNVYGMAQRVRDAGNILRVLRDALSRPEPAQGGALRDTLEEHWLTSTNCDKGGGTNFATCSCGLWRGPVCKSQGAAVETWVEHVLAESASPPSEEVRAVVERCRARAETLERLGRENRPLTSEYDVATVVLTREILRDAADMLERSPQAPTLGATIHCPACGFDNDLPPLQCCRCEEELVRSLQAPGAVEEGALIEAIARYGGRCRECADNDGVCEGNGLPCDPALRRRAIEHVLGAARYYQEHPEFAALQSPRLEGEAK